MFEALQLIDADRKNSLPVADFSKRYLKTQTPVVFGDMSHRWPAFQRWNLAFFKDLFGDSKVALFSNKVALNKGDSLRPVMHMPASEYFALVDHEEDDLQIRNFPIFDAYPELTEDLAYPRLGLTFKNRSPLLQIGAKNAKQNMHYRADMGESFLCNFGGKQAVMMVKPEQAKFTYEPPFGFESVPTVDYSKEGMTKNPAIANIMAYYAELDHGDVLYIPSGYRYTIKYLTPSAGLILAADPITFSARIIGIVNRLIVRPLDIIAFKVFGERWYRRKLRKAVRRSKR